MRTIKRLGALGIGTMAAFLAFAAPASAGGGSTELSAGDLAAAHATAGSAASLSAAGRFFSHTNGTAAGVAADSAADSGAVRLSGGPVAVYTLNADFVRAAGAPVAVLNYVASTAVTADGRTASIWTARSATGWAVVNIASGDDEARFAAQAGPGALVFSEPQTNAWYSAKGNVILPLNEQARSEIGDRMTLAAYQRFVHARYADKLPGSAYDRSGKAGGYGAEGPVRWPWLAGAALLMIGLVVVPRRRRA